MAWRSFARYLVPTLLLLLIFPLSRRTGEQSPQRYDGRLKCFLKLRGYSSPTMRYCIGFNYEAIRCFSESEVPGLDIILASYEESLPDSVLHGSILILPASDSLGPGWNRSVELPDGSVWASEDRELVSRMNIWISHYSASETGLDAVERFTPGYEPYKRALSGQRYKYASPYDDLLKKYAAGIGWDWRMLAALVWKESAFRIEARSSKGAEGLMQMMPSTADKYQADNMLDPEENLRAACDYIGRLHKMFEDDTSDPVERMKFTLAAYNAGEGRIKDMISYAKAKGLPHGTWLELEAVLPDMRQPSIREEESVRNGMFKGYETMEYIREMQSLYWAFCVIAPGQSWPGQLRLQNDSLRAEEALSPDTLSRQ